MKRVFVIGWFLLVSVGCRVEAITHNPVMAFWAARAFLRSLYIEEDYSKAIELAHEALRRSITQEGLRQIVGQARESAGNLQELTVDSYLQTPGRTIELFFVEEGERGMLYHRIVLIGDASMDYKVSGVWFASKPYPPNPLRKTFAERYVIQ